MQADYLSDKTKNLQSYRKDSSQRKCNYFQKYKILVQFINCCILGSSIKFNRGTILY